MDTWIIYSKLAVPHKHLISFRLPMQHHIMSTLLSKCQYPAEIAMCEPDVFIILWSNVKIRENINNMAWIYGEQLIIHHVLLGAAGLIWINCNCSQGSTRIGLLLWLVVLRSDEHVLWTLIQNTRIVGLWYRQVSGIAEVPACIPSIWETSENYREYTKSSYLFHRLL